MKGEGHRGLVASHFMLSIFAMGEKMCRECQNTKKHDGIMYDGIKDKCVCLKNNINISKIPSGVGSAVNC